MILKPTLEMPEQAQ